MCNLAKQFILDSGDMTPGQKLVAYRVAELVNDHHDHLFWMRSESLAAETGLDDGTVRKYLKLMVDRGWMVKTRQGGGRFKTTEYQFVGCAHLHKQKPRPQARYEETAPVVGETAPVIRDTAPVIRNTAPGGARIKENRTEQNEQDQKGTPLFENHDLQTPWQPTERHLAVARELELDDPTIARVVTIVRGLDLTDRRRGPEFVTRCGWEARAIARAGPTEQSQKSKLKEAAAIVDRGIADGSSIGDMLKQIHDMDQNGARP